MSSTATLSRFEHKDSAGLIRAGAAPLSTRSRRVSLVVVLAVLIVGGTGLVAARAGLYSDDWVHLQLVSQRGVLGTCLHYWEINGFLRPCDYLLICTLHRWAGVPLSHGLLVVVHLINVLLMWKLIARMTGSRSAGVLGAALFAVWHSSGSTVVWLAAGQGVLPATTFLLGALLVYDGYLRETRNRRTLAAAAVLYGVSLLFYEQQIIAASVFSVLAWMVLRRLRSSWPFWAVAALVAGVLLFTSAGSERSLAPDWTVVPTKLMFVMQRYVSALLMAPVSYFLHPREFLAEASLFLAIAPEVLLASLALLVLGVISLARKIGRVEVGNNDQSHVALAVVVGITLAAVTIAASSLRSIPRIDPRHTYMVAVGVVLVLSGVITWAIRRWRVATVRSCAIVVLLSGVVQLMSGYAWIEGRQVTDRVLASLSSVYPAPADGDLLVIDGLQAYGRGFHDSWGLSSAVSLKTGKDVRVTTLVRTDAGRLVANRSWDEPWQVDGERTEFFRWDRERHTLLPSSWSAYADRHNLLGADAPDMEVRK